MRRSFSTADSQLLPTSEAAVGHDAAAARPGSALSLLEASQERRPEGTGGQKLCDAAALGGRPALPPAPSHLIQLWVDGAGD